ncbi:sulfotransferase domain-containing protein [Thalassorhabdomicrobium marinisediminis]|uniref:sulfotransferase domain-containing protein n=1 Tax=Thalassorhabdomicrobium marinisediminis TaxID=2170577 RepID=UPI002491F5A4|nr:sulfotransferase domain-containing protein [Thalassorhabdomicrobium marinisediminis]
MVYQLFTPLLRSQKALDHFRKKRLFTYTRPALYEALLNNGHYIFTQQKAGTNYLCNVLAFYNSRLIGTPCNDFDRISEFGVVRGVQKSATRLRHALDFAQTGHPVYFQSHDFIDVPTKHAIVVSRSVLDYAVSSYHFHYVNFSKRRRQKTVDDALGPIVENYIRRHKGQRQAVRNAARATTVRYEALKQDPHTAFSRVITDIHGRCDTAALSAALEDASVKRVTTGEFERTNNEMVKRAGVSLIRSGTIGEGQEFFSPEQRNFVFDALASQDIDPENPFNDGWNQ